MHEVTDLILADDWSSYDEIKERNNESKMIVNLSHRWKLVFIEKIIQKHCNASIDVISICMYDFAKQSIPMRRRAEVIKEVVNALAKRGF